MNIIKSLKIVMFGIVLITCTFVCMPVSAQAKNISDTNEVVATEQSDGADTGVNELDASINRGTNLLVGLTRSLGGAVTLVGIVIAAIGFFGHQEELKAKAPIITSVGVVIYFANEIMNFLVGK